MGRKRMSSILTHDNRVCHLSRQALRSEKFQVDEEVRDFAERLSVGAPVALELAKKSIGVAASSGAPGESGLEFEAQSAPLRPKPRTRKKA